MLRQSVTFKTSLFLFCAFGRLEANLRDQTALELEKVRALELRRSWMIVNEVRQRESLEWIPGGEEF